MPHLRSAALCFSALSFFAPATYAALITFNASGVTADNSILSGTVTIDDTAGLATAVNLTLSAPLSFTATNLGGQGAGLSFYTISASGPGSDAVLRLPTTTLVGYTGGSLCSVSVTCALSSFAINGALNASFSSGSLTPIPEPASALLIVGGLAALQARRLRRRLGAAVCSVKTRLR